MVPYTKTYSYSIQQFWRMFKFVNPTHHQLRKKYRGLKFKEETVLMRQFYVKQ